MNFDQIVEVIFKNVEKFVGKRENAGYKNFPFPTSFSEAAIS